jgi:transcriptional regulator with XRE-family HTH domain
MTNFDWEQASDDDRDSEKLSDRLVATLPARKPDDASTRGSPEARQFGKYVAALRRARGWSRPELAEHARIDPLTVPLLENGVLPAADLTPALVERVAEAFDIPSYELAISPFPAEGRGAFAAFGAWLADALAPLLRPASVGYLGGIRGAELGHRDGELVGEQDVLTAPLPLPEVEVTLPPDGRPGRVLSTLEPGDPPEAGAADIQLRVLDAEDRPVTGVVVELELQGLPYTSTPTDEDGLARVGGEIGGVPWNDLMALEQWTPSVKDQP